jgi:hypothetical protein
MKDENNKLFVGEGDDGYRTQLGQGYATEIRSEAGRVEREQQGKKY